MQIAGRWYGSKSNGDVVEKCIESIESIVFVNLRELKEIESEIIEGLV
jgi:hypothetical protein